MAKRFSRNKEDFTCEYCDNFVKGNGYTNHCPACLWSKHVDINPGDRASKCGGLMKPIGAQVKHDEYIIAHECVICGYRKNNKSTVDDNIDLIISFSVIKLALFYCQFSDL